MNRNMKLGIAVLMVALFVGLTYGAVVTYLSNQVTADITVTSPMEVGVSLGEDSWGGEHFPTADWDYEWDTTITISDVLGGETVTIYTKSANLADAEIMGFEEAIVTNSDGVTCGDFESVVVRVDSIYGDLGYGTPQELIGTGGCQQITWNTIQFGDLGLSTWGAGETDVTEIVVTFKPAASGTYTFTYRVVPEAPIP